MRFLTAAALSLGLAAPASALDLSAMSEAERTAFGAAVRGYLLENPEVLMEAIGVLEQRQETLRPQRGIRQLGRGDHLVGQGLPLRLPVLGLRLRGGAQGRPRRL